MITVHDLVRGELERANKIFPPFHSAHEGYAVLLEEVEEADEELRRLKIDMDGLWKNVKKDGNVEAYCNLIYDRAEDLIKESIQVAAMACKLLEFYTRKTQDGD